MSAQVCRPPAAIALTPLARPTTSTGVLLSVVVPIPSWPVAFQPQHFRPPPLVRAQECSPPTAIPLTPFSRPATSTGTPLLAVVPWPSWPFMLAPQHFAPPPVVTTQVWSLTAMTSVVGVVSAATGMAGRPHVTAATSATAARRDR